MSTIDKEWLAQFDAAMKRFFAIDHAEAGLEEAQLQWYADLPPREAALRFGEDYDVPLVDVWWGHSPDEPNPSMQ